MSEPNHKPLSPSYAQATTSDPHPTKNSLSPWCALHWLQQSSGSVTEIQDINQGYALNTENAITWNKWFLFFFFFFFLRVKDDYTKALSTGSYAQYMKNSSTMKIQNKWPFSFSRG